MVAAEKLALYLIPLIVLVLLGMFYYGPSGAFGKAQNITTGVIDFVNATIGADELAGGVPTIPESHREAILKLKETIQEMLASDEAECFANYESFPDLGEEGTSIIMVYNEAEDRTDFRVLGGEGGQQVITNLLFSVEGMHPCVVAGGSATNFFGWFISGDSRGDTLMPGDPYFTPVNQLTIAASSDANVIRVPELTDFNHDDDDNFQDGGWLFTPDNQHICFFPTNQADNHDVDGIDNNYISDSTQENSIAWQASRDSLNRCFIENGEMRTLRIDCESGVRDSCRLLSSVYILEGQIDRGTELMRQNCNADDGISCRQLVEFYQRENSEELTLKETNKYYHLGCINGDSISCDILGDFYNDLSFTPELTREQEDSYITSAIDYYQKACDLKDWESCNSAGMLYSQNNDLESITYYGIGCVGQSRNLGDFSPSACENLAYRFGVNRENHDEAIELYNTLWLHREESGACLQLNARGINIECPQT